VTVTWHAYEVRPKGSPPIPEWYMEHIRATRPRFEAAALAHYGLKIKSGPFGINSRPAMIGAKYAATQGKGEEYNRAMLRAYWQEGHDISDLAVMREVARQVGLDADEFTAALDETEFMAEVDVDIWQARRYGLDGAPAMIFAGRYLVVGAQPYDELCRVVEQIETKSPG
jgi:predicted DsbA family dithiol-disulfide isomerase